MQLTDEQFATLAPYEAHFTTALRSSYPRSPGRAALKTIHAILREIEPTTPALNTTCGTCILRVLKKAGALYFEAKDLKAIKAMENADPGDPLLKGIRQAEIDKANDALAVLATKEAAEAARKTPDGKSPRQYEQGPQIGQEINKSQVKFFKHLFQPKPLSCAGE